MYLLKNDVVFIRTPKTGSTWCLDVINHHGLLVKEFGHNHGKYEDLPKVWKSARFKFCFVREPDDWYMSYFNWRKKTGWIKDTNEYTHTLDIDCHADEFDLFMANVNKKHPDFCETMMQKYSEGCHFVGDFNNLRRHMSLALKLAGFTDIDASFIKNHPPQKVGSYSTIQERF